MFSHFNNQEEFNGNKALLTDSTHGGWLLHKARALMSIAQDVTTTGVAVELIKTLSTLAKWHTGNTTSERQMCNMPFRLE